MRKILFTLTNEAAGADASGKTTRAAINNRQQGEEIMKTLHNSDISAAKQNVKDIKVVGNGDSFRLLFKASSDDEGWMKSTKAYEIHPIGCIVQVTTQQRNPNGGYSVAEALTFVPNVAIVEDENGGRKLVSTASVPPCANTN